jgi:hypothetical protein
MDPLIKHKSGGQPGNQNARKHGFYSNVLSGDEKRYWKRASLVDGLSEEIIFLRVKLRSLANQDQFNLSLFNQTIKTLGRLYEIDSAHGQDNNQFKEAVKTVLEEFTIPIPPVREIDSSDRK